MSVPEKSRKTILRETLGGIFAAVVGLVLIFVAPEEFAREGFYVGLAFVAMGFYYTNKKLTAEWLAELREFIPFLPKGKK